MIKIDKKQYYLSLLEDISTKHRTRLQKYVLKPNPLQSWVDAENQEIYTLEQIYDYIDNNECLEEWRQINTELRRLKDIDPYADSAIITLNFGKGNINSLSICQTWPYDK